MDCGQSNYTSRIIFFHIIFFQKPVAMLDLVQPEVAPFGPLPWHRKPYARHKHEVDQYRKGGGG